MTTPVRRSARPPRRRAPAGVVGALTLVLAAGCTGGASQPGAGPGPSRGPVESPSVSAGSPSTMRARPAPLKVVVTRVSGRLSPQARHALEGNVKAVLARYLDAAYLGGTYPRSDFSAAYASFTPAVRAQARHDGWLLTNRSLGPTAQAVVARKQAAYLSVLAPYSVAAGLTARLHLEYVVDRGARPARQVTVTGRLMLTRHGHGWAIFAYDVSRSVRSVKEGAA